MLKKMMILILLSAISIAPIAPLAEISNSTKINSVIKMPNQLKGAGRAPVILLAANETTQLQNMNEVGKTDSRKGKVSSSKEITSDSSGIAPEVWLIMVALLGFVMRSSRRVV